MIVEMHILQNFAPANLNRDDTNAPKDCEFGGYRRARISSQAIKRAMRDMFRDNALLPADALGWRTKRLAETLTDRLVEQGKDPATAAIVADAAIAAMGLKYGTSGADGEKKTQYLLFLGEGEVDRITGLCLTHWDELAGGTATKQSKGKTQSKPKGAFVDALDGGKAADVALFGRMLADLPLRNVDAAAQVAHAISTNQVNVEFDFYTAIDDLKPEDTEGADMMGTVEFNSSCFYRYANVDLNQLRTNLDGDDELARATLRAFVRANVLAIPTGKQNSMAAHNPPSFAMAVVRHGGRWSLANAFLKPVRPSQQTDLVVASQERLIDYWQRLAGVYGVDDLGGTWCISLHPDSLGPLAGAHVGSLSRLIDHVEAAAFDGGTP